MPPPTRRPARIDNPNDLDPGLRDLDPLDPDDDEDEDAVRLPTSVATTGLSTTDAPDHEALIVQPMALHLMEPHPLNPNEETEETFRALCETLAEDGPDQPIVVVPKLDAVDGAGPQFVIIKGMHRWKAANALGWATFPVIVRTNWDEMTQISRLIRDNVARGTLNKKKFTTLVQHARREHQIDSDLMAALSGFSSTQEMYRHMVKETKKGTATPSDDAAVLAAASHATVPTVFDDVSAVVSALIAKHGATLPQGYMAFPQGGKLIWLVELLPELHDALTRLAQIADDRKVDLNLLLSTIIADAIPSLTVSWRGEQASVPSVEP